MNGSLEIRKLPPWAVFGLVQVLEYGNGWKTLMASVPKNILEQPFVPKYQFEHVKLIENASVCQQRSCAEIFLEEWGCSGRQQPNLATLRNLLVKAQLFRAAEFVAVKLLEENTPERPATGPAASVDVSEQAVSELSSLKIKEPYPLSFEDQFFNEVQNLNDDFSSSSLNNEIFRVRNSFLDSEIGNAGLDSGTFADDSIGSGFVDSEENDLQHISNNGVYVAQETLLLGETTINSTISVAVVTPPELNTLLPHYPYSELEKCTANFCEIPLPPQGVPGIGRKLGTGAFGSVYLGLFSASEKVAVKKLNRDAVNIEKQFQNEVEALSRYKHSNLLPLLGYSCDGPAFCLVYQYMSNGSLQERLACQDLNLVLPWQERLDIAMGTSEGILHLHTAYEKPLIHRDIKSANILLDHNLKSKLGDFGLVRLGASGQQSQSVALTTTIFGTSAYMAPEAFRGDISVKLDTFSFGVVLLELLTSLPPFDDEREGCDLVTHVDEICEDSIDPLLDNKAGTWRSERVHPSDLYLIALDSLKEKRHRPNMYNIVQRLHSIVTAYTE